MRRIDAIARWGPVLLCGWALGAGCGDDAPPELEGTRPAFDEAVLMDPAERFFDFPFPSDLRTDPAGHPDLEGFPTVGNLLPQALAVVERERPGFPPGGAIYFRFDGALDPASLPADPADTTEDDSSVWLVDIDPQSPERGRRVPATVRYHPETDQFWPGNVVTVRPVPGLTMRPGTRHAAIVRAGVRAADGTDVLPRAEFEALKEGSSTGAVGEHYDDLFAELESLGIPRDEVLMATSFTTSDPALEMARLREEIRAQPLPTVGWTEMAGTDPATYVGQFETYEFFSGTPPYTDGIGDGGFRFDDNGDPLDMTARPVDFAITVPDGAPPEGGFPIVLYGHGTDGSERSHTGVDREGAAVATVGAAMIGFEAALHGARSTGDLSPEELLFVNPVAARDMIRQTVVDMMLMYRMIEQGAFDIPSTVTGDVEVPFSSAPVLYMGHSQGSQEAGLLLGVEPTVEAAFLSAGGGGSLIAVFDREFEGQLIKCLVALAVGVSDCMAFTEDHPAAWVVQALLDPADPLHFAHRFLRERPPSAAALSVYMTEGTADTYTPPRSIEALGAAIGLPQVEPLVQSTLPYQLLGLPTVTAPVESNLVLPNDGGATGGVVQWDGAGHFLIYNRADGEDAYVEWFRTALEGTPTIIAR